MVYPCVATCDRTGTFPYDAVRKLGELLLRCGSRERGRALLPPKRREPRVCVRVAPRRTAERLSWQREMDRLDLSYREVCERAIQVSGNQEVTVVPRPRSLSA